MTTESGTIAERLEKIRGKRGLDRKAFWREIVAESTNNEGDVVYGWKDPKKGPRSPRISYDTVLNYLAGEHEVPGYVAARVCRVFGVREEWLLTGEGAIWKPHREVRGEALHEAIAEAYPERFRDLLTSRAQDLFLHVLMQRMRSAQDAPAWVRGVAWDSPEDVPEVVVEHAGDLLHVLYEPIWRETRPEGEAVPAALRAWGVIGARHVTPDHLERYVRRFLDALEAMTPAPGQGDPWDDAPKSQPRRDRKAIEAVREKMAEAEIDDQRPLVGDTEPGEEEA